ACEEAQRAGLTHDLSTVHELASVHDAGRIVLPARARVAALGEATAARSIRDRHRDRRALQLARRLPHLLRTDRNRAAAERELLRRARRGARAGCDYAARGHQ